MAGFGLRRPGISAAIAGAISAAGAIGVVAGIYDMTTQGRETTLSALSIGVGGVVAVIGVALLYNFLRGVQAVSRINRGVAVIARWTMTPAEVDAFRDDEERKRQAGHASDYRPPRRTPSEGLPVAFAEDAVLVGDTYFALVSTGMFTFEDFEVLADTPRTIQFGTRMTTLADTGSAFSVRTSTGVLRIPVARTANEELRVVVRHFREVLSELKIVNADFYPSRIRIGLVGAVVCAIIAGIGFGMVALEIEMGDVPLILAVGGTVGAMGGLLLAGLAFMLRSRQYRGRKKRF